MSEYCQTCQVNGPDPRGWSNCHACRQLREKPEEFRGVFSTWKDLKVAELEQLKPKHEELLKAYYKVEQERDEYQAKVHELSERVGNMTSAASSAAATTVTALERIQKMEKVVEAAIRWKNGGSHAELTDEVTAWLAYKKTWS